MRSRKPNYMIVDRGNNYITIRDMGPWDKFLSITNGAEEVVAELIVKGELKNGKKLLYWDTDNKLDQILHWDGKLMGFTSSDADPYNRS